MRLAGTKFSGHDSSIGILDFRRREITALSTERVTRIKHDDIDVGEIIERWKKDGRLPEEVDLVAHSFQELGDLRIYWGLQMEHLFREIFHPRYRKDIERVKRAKIKGLIEGFKRAPVKMLQFLYYYFNFFYLGKLLPLRAPTHPKMEQFARERLALLFGGATEKRIEKIPHHLSHGAAAYYFSPFAFNKKPTLSFTLDGWGDDKFSALYLFNGKNWREVASSPEWGGKRIPINLRFSIGGIYMNFTEGLGLVPNSDEGKVEALAAFGKPDPELYNRLMEVFKVEGLQFKPNLEAARRFYDLNYLKKELERVGPENFAASVQRWLEDIVVEYLQQVGREFPEITQLCLSGGVTANIIMNLNIWERTQFKELYILPPMGDDGSALGAAILKGLELGLDLSWLKEQQMPYWGDSYSKEEVEQELHRWRDRVEWRYLGDEWYREAAREIAEGKIVALFQGRMEFGPRALGNRSILADPRRPETKERINSTVKRRPHYQPFCPSILEEERERLFEASFHHKHMAIAFRMKREFWEQLPSAIHIDGTARPQFVTEQDNPSYYRLLKELKRLTGFGVVINTSFNLHGRTIVRTPADALTDFLDCNIDTLYIEGFQVKPKPQPTTPSNSETR